MRRLSAAVILSFGLAVAGAPALAQSGHSHSHGHAHDDHDHDHGKKKTKAAPAVHKAAPPAELHAHDHGIETETLFGFVSGSDIGERGEKHLTLFYENHFGKRSGTFRAQQSKAEFGYNPTDWLHVALEVWGDHFKVQNVPELENQNRWGAGAAIEFKVQLAKRGEGSPVGLALVLAPHYGNSEHHSGEAATHWAMEAKLAADAELVKDRVFAAFNLLYEPERVRAKGETEWEKESLFGISGALMTRVAPSLFVGAELQYFRAYEGYAFNEFHGHALYLGPVLTWQVSEHAMFTLAWAAQVAGKAADEPNLRLDLDHFERHRVLARYSAHF
jgi:hypothetical protein